MVTRVLRQVVNINEDRCDGCGLCIPSCAEGALHIVDGKAKLISESYCDGLGACLGECPQGAITIEEREADGFDEKAVADHLGSGPQPSDELPCGCPSASVMQFEGRGAVGTARTDSSSRPSKLGQWPVQLALVPPTAPFLQGAEVVLAADCVPFAYAGFHEDFLSGRALLVACPKLDDFSAHQSKLTDIVSYSGLKSLTVVVMEVPCCSGLAYMAGQAIQASGADLPFRQVTIGVRGNLIS